MIKFVLGFAFNFDYESVLLIRKNKPIEQAGLLNGVGGKLEDSDFSSRTAMIREFKEETNISSTIKDWKYFCKFKSKDIIVYCYKSNILPIHMAESITEEKLEIHKIKFDNAWIMPAELAYPNLNFLIPLAMHDNIINPLKIVFND